MGFTAPATLSIGWSVAFRLGDRDSNPDHRVQGPAFCRLNYPRSILLTDAKDAVREPDQHERLDHRDQPPDVLP
jgi:hypothetical protein